MSQIMALLLIIIIVNYPLLMVFWVGFSLKPSLRGPLAMTSPLLSIMRRETRGGDRRARSTAEERGSSVARLGRISPPIWQPWLNWYRQGCKIGWKIWPNLATPPGSSTLLLGDHNTERSRRNESDKPGMNSATIRSNPSSPMNLSD